MSSGIGLSVVGRSVHPSHDQLAERIVKRSARDGRWLSDKISKSGHGYRSLAAGTRSRSGAVAACSTGWADGEPYPWEAVEEMLNPSCQAMKPS